MNEPLASCVCPTFNRPHLLNELVYCFLNQDYENKELIILNDKVDVIYQYNDPRVKIFNYNERFYSLGAKRNRSRDLVNGEYIFIMDDDDIYYSNHISRLIEFHQENSEYDVVCNGNFDYSQDNKDVVNHPNPFPFNGACIKREYYLKNEFPNKKSSGEDQDFVKYAKVKRIMDGKTSWHYRWGLNIWHISGISGDGMDLYSGLSYLIEFGELKIINIEPQISEDVKEYYR
jgi:glycosyltransferase involved in cell wall biosynthesis